jgi:hypothetical protein
MSMTGEITRVAVKGFLRRKNTILKGIFKDHGMSCCHILRSVHKCRW